MSILSDFGDLSSDRIINGDSVALDKTAWIRERVLKLYDSPTERQDSILGWFITAEIKNMAKEVGIDVATGYYGKVAELVDLSITELSGVPIKDRGNIWNEAVSIIMSASQRQAFIESGLASESLLLGAELGNELKGLAPKLSKDDILNADYHVADKIKAKQNNG